MKEHFIKFLSRVKTVFKRAVSRVHPFVLVVSCVGILIAYLVGMYATGPFHKASRWMGALLACTSVVMVLQAETFRNSLRPAWMRMLGTFIGVVIGYIYLRYFHFSIIGMLLSVFLLEMFCMMLDIYSKSRIATITLIIILLISQMEPNVDPLTNCLLRFFESGVGVGVGLLLLGVIERWNTFINKLRSSNSGSEEVDMESMPLRLGHLRVLAIASLEQFAGGALATLVGVVLPMYLLVSGHHLSAVTQGVVASMSMVGIMIGSLFVGAWSDRHGYLRFFRLCPVIVLTGSLLVVWMDNIIGLIVGLLIMGFGIGGGYSLDSDYISEIMPRRSRLVMVGIAKATSALGNVVVAFLCYFILGVWKSPEAWNKMLLLISLIALVTILCRVRFTESPGWLMAQGYRAEAERTVKYILGQDVVMRGEIEQRDADVERGKNEWRELFLFKNWRRVVFSGVPWACEGFGVYGVGVFLPVLIMALRLGGNTTGMEHITTAVKLSGWINLFVLAGFVGGLIVVGRVWQVRQQMWGFWLAALGLVLLWIGYVMHLPDWTMIAGFIIYELMLNAGPHLITYIVPAQIYSIADRGAGIGLAAAFGKAGGILGVLFMPILLKAGGVELVLGVVPVLLIIGGVVTWLVGRRVMPRCATIKK